MDRSADITQALLAWIWLPALTLAGLLDWDCHRRQRIQFTAGLAESALHLLMLGAVGGAIVAAVLLQATAGLLLAVLTALLVHEGLYAADLQVALARRRIPALEQWVHGFQHLLPWAGLAGLVVLAPGQAWALLGRGAEAADWALRWRQPLPPWPVWATVTAAGLLNVLPFLAEAWRCARAANSARSDAHLR